MPSACSETVKFRAPQAFLSEASLSTDTGTRTGTRGERERHVTRKEKRTFQERVTAFVPNAPNRERTQGFAEADTGAHMPLMELRQKE